jgi:hypothetical protein
MRRVLSIVLLSLAFILAGCSEGRYDAQGYFYVTSTDNGYVVAQNISSPVGSPTVDRSTVYVTKASTIEVAKSICDQLNRDLKDKVIPNQY